MIRYTIQGDAEFQRMLTYLTNYPKILDRKVEPVLRKTIQVAKSSILSSLSSRKFATGRAYNALEDAILGFGSHITGVVGFPGGKDSPWYINIVEHGARRHSLAPTGRRNKYGGTSGSRQQRERREAALEKKLAAGKSLSGQHVFIGGEWRTVRVHPGFSAAGFMAKGFSLAKPVFDEGMQKAVQNAFNEVSR